MAKVKTNKIKLFAGLGFVLIFLALLVFLFAGENFAVLKEIFRSNATKSEIQQSIEKLGFRSYFVVGVLAMLQVIFTFVPAEPLHVISGISFGLWKGILVCFVGILLGNTIIYVLNKIYGEKLKDFFSTNVNFDFNSAKTSKKIALIVIILYCLPAIPYGIICFFAASMNMKYPKYMIITGLGSLPSLLLDVGLGHITMSTSWLISIIVFVVIIVLLILMLKFKTQIFNKINEYVAKNKEKEKNKVGNYNPLIYNVVGNAVYGMVKSKIKIKLKNNVEKLEKPSIVLINHGSFYDFLYAGKLMKKERPHFIVARLYFHHKILKKILSATGAFPKSMFTNDVESTKNCLKVINSKGILAMMPEARLSTVGTFEGIQNSTFKFIKKMNVPVYAIKINGAYLAKPKWAKSVRKKAVVEAELNQLFSAEEIQNATLENIQTKVEEALNYNEWEWLEKNPQVTYKSKDIAEGLENILCVCPKCNEKFSIKTEKSKIICEKCGLIVDMDNRYQLSNVEFKNIMEWYNWQKEVVRNEIKNNPNFCLESKVELRHLSKNGKGFTTHAGEGVCKLNKNGLTFQGTDNGVEVQKVFGIDSIYRILFGAGEDFEIYENNEIYYFVPEEKRSCVIWYIVSEIFKE